MAKANIKNQLQEIRKVLDTHLDDAREKLKADIKIGKITYNTDEDGNLSGFKAEMKFQKEGFLSKEERNLKQFLETAKKEKLFSSKINPTQWENNGNKFTLKGINFSRPKNLFEFVDENGGEYIGNIDHFIGVLNKKGMELPRTQSEFDDFKFKIKCAIYQMTS